MCAHMFINMNNIQKLEEQSRNKSYTNRRDKGISIDQLMASFVEFFSRSLLLVLFLLFMLLGHPVIFLVFKPRVLITFLY